MNLRPDEYSLMQSLAEADKGGEPGAPPLAEELVGWKYARRVSGKIRLTAAGRKLLGELRARYNQSVEPPAPKPPSRQKMK